MDSGISALFSLKGTTSLVTGAGSGIGRQMSMTLAKAGSHVILLGRRDESLQQTIDDIAQFESAPAPRKIVADLCQVQSWADFVQTHQLTQVDILANVAGINLRESSAEISPKSWDQTLNINLKIPFFLAQSIVPAMQKKGWGKIINIASLQSQRAFANSIPYGTSKGGVVQLTRAMAQAWSASGICANAIAPGFFPTELTAPVFNDPKWASQNSDKTAMKRNGEMADLEGISLFLASHASDYITGQTIFIDGGFSAL